MDYHPISIINGVWHVTIDGKDVPFSNYQEALKEVKK